MAAAGLAVLAIPEVAKIIQAAMNPVIHREDDGVFISCNLAASYGKLADHLKLMDDQMKVMIGTTIAQLEQLPKEELSWEKVKESLFNNPCLEPMGEEDVQNYDSLVKTTTCFFASGATEADDDSPKVLEAESWIKKLISDEDVIANLSFDPRVYAKFVSCTGTALDKLENSSFVKREKHFKTVLDIGILRFPDMDEPYFKAYRLSLKAFRDCTHTFLLDFNNNGMVGEFNSRKFKIREEFVKKIKPETQTKALEMVDNLFP